MFLSPSGGGWFGRFLVRFFRVPCVGYFPGGVSCLEEAGHFCWLLRLRMSTAAVSTSSAAKRPGGGTGSRPTPKPPLSHPVRLALSRASPRRFTSLDAVCHEQPSSSSASATVLPRPTCHVAHLPARVVNRARTGAIRGSCSVNDPTPHPASGRRPRRFRHSRITDRPKLG